MAIPGSSKPAAPPGYAWYRDLNGYQWFVVAVAAIGWMFDTMAQQLFNLARVPALRDLMGTAAAPGAVAQQAGISTMVFMVGWGLGGVVFGILGDRLGRAKTMMLTILAYTIFTGMSLLSTGVWDFNVYPVAPGAHAASLRTTRPPKYPAACSDRSNFAACFSADRITGSISAACSHADMTNSTPSRIGPSGRMK